MSYNLEHKSVQQLIDEDLTLEQLYAITTEPTKGPENSSFQRDSYCKNFHPRTVYNTKWRSKNGRQYRVCQDCVKDWQQERNAKLRAEKRKVK